MNKLFSLIFVLFFVNAAVSFDSCGVCVDFVDNSLNDLLNIILNSGVLGTCNALCSKVPGGQIVDTICNLACDAVGVDEFVKLISDVDPDPIYICEECKVCKTNNNAAATLELVQINPVNGTVGGTFTISIAYTVTNTIATGQLAFNIIDPTGNGFGDAVLLVQQTPEQYTQQFQFQATPSEQEAFPNGLYTLQAAVCEGSCGSPHPYTYTLANGTTTFTISGSDSSSMSGSFTGSSQSSATGAASGSGSGAALF
ncbi:hypothetical protein RB653_001821 [Dictyostelium firmibasis]|uniref:Saposin B-type domain-containing protein n=1 Tax=Dictyostelium firmibasis TaxID=79012 RepID=A0AAN7TPN0_9MYCE